MGAAIFALVRALTVRPAFLEVAFLLFFVPLFFLFRIAQILVGGNQSYCFPSVTDTPMLAFRKSCSKPIGALRRYSSNTWPLIPTRVVNGR